VKEAQKSKSDGNMAPTIFHGMLNNTNLPDSEKTTPRLLDEAIVLVGAGTDTTANTLAALTYHILANPDILKKLKTELAEAIPDVETLPESTRTETLPYLTAVIQEGIRLHPGATLRQERVAPDEELLYEDTKGGKKYVIARGVRRYPFSIEVRRG
jgi:cytochrome P450